MRIGELAARAGVSVRALRYYEEQQLLDAERTPGGQRSYPEGAVDRIRWLQLLYAAGLPSRTIRQLLPCVLTGVLSPDRFDQLVVERDRIQQRITTLTATRERLDAVIEASVDYLAP